MRAIGKTGSLCTAIWLAWLVPSWAEEVSEGRLEKDYQSNVQPLLARYCGECHEGDEAEADVDLAQFKSLTQIRQRTKLWQRVDRMLRSRQMPPKEADQPTDKQRQVMADWVRTHLRREAEAHAGDPGPVVLRRLSNAEYTYTLRDLTGVASLNPAREFPVDGAAGEGFTNTGDALGMSPALVGKYLDAGKEVASHAFLLPDGIRFSPHATPRDWADDALERIRGFYRQFVAVDGVYLDWQGSNNDAELSGRLPLPAYLDATLRYRDDLRSGRKSIDQVAEQTKLNPEYLSTLWMALDATGGSSFLLDELRDRWRRATPANANGMAAEIAVWQRALWQFNRIGHLGRENAPKSWMSPKDPVTIRQTFTLELPDSNDPVTIFLASTNIVGDDRNVVIWRSPRLERTGHPPILLRDAPEAYQRIVQLREESRRSIVQYLDAVAAVQKGKPADLVVDANQLNPTLLNAWLKYLGVGPPKPVAVSQHFTKQMQEIGGYNFVKGWGTHATPSIAANSSDEEVRIPGVARPHSIVAHPSPTLFVAAGWQSPIDGAVQVSCELSDAHPECGNGFEWFLQHRSGDRSTNIDHGDAGTRGKTGSVANSVEVHKGDLISVIVGPRDGNHGCDLTAVNFTIGELSKDGKSWDLAADVSGNILESNPHADQHGNKSVWHFYHGRVADLSKDTWQGGVPAGSLLAKWQDADNDDLRRDIANRIQSLVSGKASVEKDQPDARLREQLLSLINVETAGVFDGVATDPQFGKHPQRKETADTDIAVQSPNVVELRVPAEFAQGRRLVVDALLEPDAGAVQLAVAPSQPNSQSLSADRPILVGSLAASRAQVDAALDEFRQLFPRALCYTKIVPVDEVVTLQLFYREDDHLRRLMLDAAQAAELDRLWDELFFVAREPLASQVALEQSYQFSTQDRPDLVVEFQKLKGAYQKRADDFRQRLSDTEPIHVDAVIEFADRAWRRKLLVAEQRRLRDNYRTLRGREIPHEEAIRLTLARVLTAPAFLYRLERPGTALESVAVSGDELAVRLSYFLWSSAPDDELRDVAATGDLTDESVLIAQTKRMLDDPRTRRMAIHFACQWLKIRDFDQNAEKNERLYPEFAELRAEMYEEAVQFFEDMFRNDGCVLNLLAANHTFVNQSLARHYGIDGVVGGHWRRVERIRDRGRGGVLGMAAVLASQSGASRTSPILRGNWIYETLLGERLPRPPANVPQLPDSIPSGLTARQLIEQHSSVPACAKCHEQIDPYGFALEQYDAIGRLRERRVDTKTVLVGGEEIEGLDDLRDYLLHQRQSDVLRQFCKKLLGYALGREVQLSDELLLEDMQAQLKAHDHRFSVAIESVVKSPQFREIRGKEHPIVEIE